MNRRQRARRALERQLSSQEKKAQAIYGREHEVRTARGHASQRVRAVLEEVRPISPGARVLEVGSGSRGLLFFFGARNGAPLLADVSLHMERIDEFPTRVEQRRRIPVVVPDRPVTPVKKQLTAAGRVLPFAAE